MKKFLLSIFLLTTSYFLLATVTHSQVNIINDWSGSTINNIRANFGDDAFVVVAADPNSDVLVDVINANNFNWVIRGHSHWLTTI